MERIDLIETEDDFPPFMAEESCFVPAEKADLEDLELVIGVFIG